MYIIEKPVNEELTGFLFVLVLPPPRILVVVAEEIRVEVEFQLDVI